PEGADDIADMAACGTDEREVIVGDVEDVPPSVPGERPESQLSHWPVQLHLVSPQAPFLKGKELLVTADCVPFAMASFHQDYLRGRSVVIGCPKLDDARAYLEKFEQIFAVNDFEKVILLHMEVPCCFGLKVLVERAILKSGKQIELEEVTVSIQGKEI
ncbi:MAG: 4Fe-4S ferredoxin, partial [Thermoplasmata archaeon]|nr:4Fe-4S ferredoxin [Thermoplasmata archaeon]